VQQGFDHAEIREAKSSALKRKRMRRGHGAIEQKAGSEADTRD
jgi:hypothetical protein